MSLAFLLRFWAADLGGRSGRQIWAADLGGRSGRQIWAADLGGRSGRQIWAADLGGRSGRQIWAADLGGRSGRQIWAADLGGRSGRQIWAADLGGRSGRQIWAADLGGRSGRQIWAADLGGRSGRQIAAGSGRQFSKFLHRRKFSYKATPPTTCHAHLVCKFLISHPSQEKVSLGGSEFISFSSSYNIDTFLCFSYFILCYFVILVLQTLVFFIKITRVLR